MRLVVIFFAIASAQMDGDFGPCPNISSSGMFARDCANMTFALDPVGDPLGATINFFVRRYYSGASPTPKALFMFQGGPGFSSVAFDGAGP